jgi:hypothetical protein
MVAKPNKKKSKSPEVDVPNAGGGKSGLERQLGNTLLLDASSRTDKPTADLMKGKKLVGLYFTASW